jgi:hypothetical protein
MGLDTSHGCWHGAYSAFNRWRDKLADAAGYTFSEDKLGRRLVQIDWGSIEAAIGADLFGRWASVPVRHDGTPDALIVLIAHSDCEGEIQVDMLTPLADRLEELIPLLVDDAGAGGHIGGSYADATRQFVDGLREAAAAGEPVEFG